MDLATVIGLGVSFGAVLVAAFISGTDLRILYEKYEAFILVIGGTMGATLVSFPLKTFIRGFTGGLRDAFFEKKFNEREVIATLVTFAEKARRGGLLALENEAAALDDEFLRKGIELVIDGRDTEIIRKILETEVGFTEERASKAEAVFMTMGGFSPTLGIIGTVLGLIAMLSGLAAAGTGGNVAGSIGGATAAAFVATFYGILLANLIWLPMAGKIKERNASVSLMREIMIEGILSIQAGDNPRLLEEKLNAYLDPAERKSDVEEGGSVATQPSPA